MSHQDLLRFANDKKPAEFATEFKDQLAAAVQVKLNPSKEEQPVSDSVDEVDETPED